MAINLKKTLYVGLGGTGVSALLKIKKCFIDVYGEIPPMIGFIAIDTDGAALSKSVTSNKGENISLEKSELLVCTVKGALNVYYANKEEYDWVPSKNVDKLSSIQGGGAGQIRSNGRFIAYYNNQKIKTCIQTVVNKINELIPPTSPYTVDTDRSGVEFPVNINVIASIAGGTGSGMLIDLLLIIRQALGATGRAFHLYPWIVLPEVFKAIGSGPSMNNVYYNTYGALKSLDYIMHHNPKNPAINFGYAKINEPLFDYAYLINNTNQAGTTFNDLDDLLDVIAKSAFLPASSMGDDLSSPFDNISVQKMGGIYDILNKKAWAASVGSAELIYDSQAVGRAIAYTTISQLCDSMLQPGSNGPTDANNFFDDKNVMIRENNGRDDIIDSLLLPIPSYSLAIDENTTECDIKNYIGDNCTPTKLEKDLKEALEKKLANTESQFNNYIKDIMSRNQGQVGAVDSFIKSLQGIVGICKGEMTTEMASYHELNSIPQQWSFLLNGVKKSGISALWGSKVDEDGVQVLQSTLLEVVQNQREEIRRDWALKFYTDFEGILDAKQKQIEALKLNLSTLKEENTNKLLAEQHNSQSQSKFQVFLHHDDAMKASGFKIDDAIKNGFSAYLENGVSAWIGQSEDYIGKKLWNFAKGTPKVKEVVNTTIESVLQQMPQDTVQKYLSHLLTLASPLWTYNPQGYNSTNLQFDKFVIVGVNNRDTSLLSKSSAYADLFDTEMHKASFASTHQDDRIYVLIVEDLLPIYAVNNFATYKQDSETKEATGFSMANYLDEKLKNRMNAENFNVMPTKETDDVLKYWVWGFVFGYIHFDTEKGCYWMRSKAKGEAIESYRYNLSNQRDVAYDMFKSEGLYKEIQESFNKSIAKTGREPIENKIQEIKEEGSYYEKYAQLSPVERNEISTDKFKSVKDLVSQEIGLMSE